ALVPPLVEQPEFVLRVGLVLVGRQPVPAQRLVVALRHALAVVVQHAHVVLGRGVALVGGQAIPPHRLGVILLHPPAAVVQEADVQLRRGVPLVGGPAVVLHRLGVVHRDAVAAETVIVAAATVSLGLLAPLRLGQRL